LEISWIKALWQLATFQAHSLGALHFVYSLCTFWLLIAQAPLAYWDAVELSREARAVLPLPAERIELVGSFQDALNQVDRDDSVYYKVKSIVTGEGVAYNLHPLFKWFESGLSMGGPPVMKIRAVKLPSGYYLPLDVSDAQGRTQLTEGAVHYELRKHKDANLRRFKYHLGQRIFGAKFICVLILYVMWKTRRNAVKPPFIKRDAPLSWRETLSVFNRRIEIEAGTVGMAVFACSGTLVTVGVIMLMVDWGQRLDAQYQLLPGENVVTYRGHVKMEKPIRRAPLLFYIDTGNGDAISTRLLPGIYPQYEGVNGPMTLVFKGQWLMNGQVRTFYPFEILNNSGGIIYERGLMLRKLNGSQLSTDAWSQVKTTLSQGSTGLKFMAYGLIGMALLAYKIRYQTAKAWVDRAKLG
jgi:hypothetical protein